MLRPGIKNAQDLACGVCLLNVDSRSKVSVVLKLLLDLHSGLPSVESQSGLGWEGP